MSVKKLSDTEVEVQCEVCRRIEKRPNSGYGYYEGFYEVQYGKYVKRTIHVCNTHRDSEVEEVIRRII